MNDKIYQIFSQFNNVLNYSILILSWIKKLKKQYNLII